MAVSLEKVWLRKVNERDKGGEVYLPCSSSSLVSHWFEFISWVVTFSTVLNCIMWPFACILGVPALLNSTVGFHVSPEMMESQKLQVC